MRRRQLMGPTPPPTVSTDLSATVDGKAPPRVHQRLTPKHWQQREIQRDEQTTALLNVLNQMAQRLGGILALDQAAAKGDVLAARSVLIGAAGVRETSWKQAAASVVVANHSPGDVVVTSAVSQSQAPLVGTGVFRVPAGIVRVLPMRGTAVSIYGLAGALVDVVALARPREPYSGMVGPGPQDGVLVPAGTTTSQTIQLNGNLTRLVVVANISAIVPGSLTVALNGLTPSGYAYPILSSAALAAVGTTPLRVGPDLPVAANSSANDVVPRELQVVATVVGAVTYGLDVVAGR